MNFRAMLFNGVIITIKISMENSTYNIPTFGETKGKKLEFSFFSILSEFLYSG